MSKLNVKTDWGRKRFKSIIRLSKDIEIPQHIVDGIARKEEQYLEAKILIQNDKETRRLVNKMLDCNEFLSKKTRMLLRAEHFMHFAGRECYLCGEEIGEDYNMDHVIPQSVARSMGYVSHTVGNIMPTHHRCNQKKGHRSPTQDEVKRAIAAYERADQKPSALMVKFLVEPANVSAGVHFVNAKTEFYNFANRYESKKLYTHNKFDREQLQRVIDELQQVQDIWTSLEVTPQPLWKKVPEKVKKVLAKHFGTIHKLYQ